MNAKQEFKNITLFVAGLKHELGGVLTLFYPEGLDIFNPAEELTKTIAQKIAEPVQLVFQSVDLGKVRSIYMPSNYDKENNPNHHEGWSKSYSYDAADLNINDQGRLVTEKEVEFARCFSGAPDVDPQYILNIFLGERDLIEKRLKELSEKTRKNVITEFQGTILHSALVGKNLPPMRPEDRRRLHEADCAAALDRFNGTGSVPLAFPQI